MQSKEDNIVYIFGDSHCLIFLDAVNKFKTCVCGLDSASITGLNRITSRLEYGKYIIDTIINKPKTHHILLKLGQVDIEFIMYYKAYVKKEIFTFEDFCQSLIDKYREFIQKVLEINKNVIIASINLPSYDNSIDIKNYISRIIIESMVLARVCLDSNTNESDNQIVNLGINSNDLIDDTKLTNFSLRQITDNFMYFNKLLSDLAKELNLLFFDTTSLFINNETKLLKNEYEYHGHHYKGFNDSTVSDAKIITHNFFDLFLTSVA